MDIRLPNIAERGIGSEYRQSRKPLIKRRSSVAIAHVADKITIKFDLYSSKSNGQAQYAREGFIGKIGKWAIGRKDGHMREKTIEQKLVAAVKSVGGICPKLVCPGFDGMPDRLVLLPKGKIAFVEVKRHGEKPRPLQEARHGLLRRLDFSVYVLDDAAQIGGLLNEIQSA